MAMGKNKTAIMAAIDAAAKTINTSKESGGRAQRTLPKGTIGSVRAGLGGIQEIDPNFILPWGPVDRLNLELTAVNSSAIPESIADLIKSISETGQQIPVLLRPSKVHDGHFEVIYGRRRILACKHLGILVKSLIRTLDDTEALMAKGLENTGREDLSFYERARFAEAILAQGYKRSEACQALSVSKNTLSQLERITRLIPQNIGDTIGAAPESGRPKWTTLAEAFEKGNLDEEKATQLLKNCAENSTSDEKLNALIKAANTISQQKSAIPEREPFAGIRIKSSKSSVSLSIERKGENAKFASWFDNKLDSLIQQSFEQFRAETVKAKSEK